MNVSALFVASLLASSGGELSTSTEVTHEPVPGFGAIAPAVLPAGAVSAYGLLGAPEVAVGYRQGLKLLELEAKVSFNYLSAAFVLEGGVRVGVFKYRLLTLAPTLALGFVMNSGARYFDTRNFGYVGLRPRAGLYGSLAFSEIVSGVFLVELPWAFGFAGGYQATPTAGVGAEFQITRELSGVVLGQLGLDVIKEPVGFAATRPGWAIRMGLGWRFF